MCFLCCRRTFFSGIFGWRNCRCGPWQPYHLEQCHCWYWRKLQSSSWDVHSSCEWILPVRHKLSANCVSLSFQNLQFSSVVMSDCVWWVPFSVSLERGGQQQWDMFCKKCTNSARANEFGLDVARQSPGGERHKMHRLTSQWTLSKMRRPHLHRTTLFFSQLCRKLEIHRRPLHLTDLSSLIPGFQSTNMGTTTRGLSSCWWVMWGLLWRRPTFLAQTSPHPALQPSVWSWRLGRLSRWKMQSQQTSMEQPVMGFSTPGSQGTCCLHCNKLLPIKTLVNQMKFCLQLC